MFWLVPMFRYCDNSYFKSHYRIFEKKTLLSIFWIPEKGELMASNKTSQYDNILFSIPWT